MAVLDSLGFILIDVQIRIQTNECIHLNHFKKRWGCVELNYLRNSNFTFSVNSL